MSQTDVNTYFKESLRLRVCTGIGRASISLRICVLPESGGSDIFVSPSIICPELDHQISWTRAIIRVPMHFPNSNRVRIAVRTTESTRLQIGVTLHWFWTKVFPIPDFETLGEMVTAENCSLGRRSIKNFPYRSKNISDDAMWQPSPYDNILGTSITPIPPLSQWISRFRSPAVAEWEAPGPFAETWRKPNVNLPSFAMVRAMISMLGKRDYPGGDSMPCLHLASTQHYLAKAQTTVIGTRC